MTLTIDPEFQALCPPLLPEEREQLEASLRAEGCREPLIVWLSDERAWCRRCEAEQPIDRFFEVHPWAQASDGREWWWCCLTCHDPIDEEEELSPLVLDGHNRYALCAQYDIPFHVHYQRQIGSREEAINWIIANQLGRRNLTPEQKSYLRGKRYNLEKRQDGGHGDQKSSTKKLEPINKKLAKEYQVSHTTIENDGDFATAVDTLEAQVRQDIRDTVLRRQDRDQGKITKQQVTKTGKLVQEQQVTPQPFMRRGDWKPYQVLEAIDRLGTLPADEHQAINALLDQPAIPAKYGLAMLTNLQAMPVPQRQRIYTLCASADPRDRSDAVTLTAKKQPDPDPQLSIVRSLLTMLETMRKMQRNNWRKTFQQEPWTEELDAIDGMMEQIKTRWQALAARITTQQAERQARYE